MQPIDIMRQALKLAELGKDTVSPNPAVGCVIVKHDKIIAHGWHQAAGNPHAEIMALQQIGNQAQGATLYVTLEPCSHYGRTPPCINAVIEAGIKKVYVASIDPNPKVKGQGIAALKQAGIEVVVGLCDTENRQLNRSFFHYQCYQRPWVIAKWAMSLDGKMVVNANDNRQISSLSSQKRVHQLRNRVDAILIGANTAVTDNPQLSVRLCQLDPIRQPQPIILSRCGQLPVDLKLLQPNRSIQTIVATTTAVDPTWRQIMEKRGVEVLVLPTVAPSPTIKNKQTTTDHYIDLTALLDNLGQRGLTSLLVEGGQATHHQFFAANLVNECQCHLAPVLIGPWQHKQRLTRINCESIAEDWHYTSVITEEED